MFCKLLILRRLEVLLSVLSIVYFTDSVGYDSGLACWVSDVVEFEVRESLRLYLSLTSLDASWGYIRIKD